MAISFAGAMYLPRVWGWLVGPVALLVTDLAFLRINYLTDGSGTMFSWWTVLSMAIYAAAGGLGLFLSQRKSLGKVINGSLACSLLFYVVSNTFSWWHDAGLHLPGDYALTFAGWWQANTVGLPGYVPTWTFLRNEMAGDLFFSLLLISLLDRNLIWQRSVATAKTTTRLA